MNSSGILFEDSFKIKVASQTYAIRGRVGFGDRLCLVSRGAGMQNALNMFTNDGDGTDPVAITQFAKGTVEDQTNFEAIKYWYNPTASEFCITTSEGGTGAFRPILIAADGQANQLRIETDGDVGINVSNPVAKLHIGGGADSMALKVDVDNYTGALTVQELAGSPHVGVFQSTRIAGNDAFSVNGNIAATGNIALSGATSNAQAINLGTGDGSSIGGTDILVGNSGVTEICGQTHISLRDAVNHEVARFKVNDSWVIADDATAGQPVKSEKFSIISQYWDGAATAEKPFEFDHVVASPSGTSQLDMGFGSTDLTFYDTGILKYANNHATSYDDRTLVDKKYVDSTVALIGGGGGDSTIHGKYIDTTGLSVSDGASIVYNTARDTFEVGVSERHVWLNAEEGSTLSSTTRSFLGTSGASFLTFGGSNPDDNQAGWSFIMPHDYRSGGRINLYFVTAATTDSVQFEVDITIAGDAQSLSTITESIAAINNEGSATSWDVHEIGPFNISAGLSTDDLITVNVHRDASDTPDTYTGDAFINVIEFQYNY